MDDMSDSNTKSYGSVTSYAYSVDPATVQLGQNIGITLALSGGYTETVNFYVTLGGAVITGLGLSRTDTGQSLFSATGALSVSLATLSNPATLTNASIFSGNDTITGNDFGNFLEGYGGNDVLNGGGGYDFAVMRGARSQYTVTRGSDGLPTRISGGSDGTDTLVSIERIKFTDVTVLYDVNGDAGQAYRLYQAAFNRTPDAYGMGYWTGTLDGGNSLRSVAQSFVTSAEFSTKYGNLSNSGFVNQLYQNVLHRAADPSGLAFHVNSLNAGASRAEVLVTFSESPENQAALVGVIGNGIVFAN